MICDYVGALAEFVEVKVWLYKLTFLFCAQTLIEFHRNLGVVLTAVGAGKCTEELIGELFSTVGE